VSTSSYARGRSGDHGFNPHPVRFPIENSLNNFTHTVEGWSVKDHRELIGIREDFGNGRLWSRHFGFKRRGAHRTLVIRFNIGIGLLPISHTNATFPHGLFIGELVSDTPRDKKRDILANKASSIVQHTFSFDWRRIGSGMPISAP